jgi:hypothetical protein
MCGSGRHRWDQQWNSKGMIMGAIGFELEALSRRERASAGGDWEPAAEIPSPARATSLATKLAGKEWWAL